MITLFGTLDMGANSLSVETEASEVTGNNLANVNNSAYSREKLLMATAPPTQAEGGEAGTGVEAQSIEQFRDSALDGEIVSQNSVTGSLTAQQSMLQQAEAYLDEEIQGSSSGSGASASSPNGIANSLSSLFNSFSALSASPSDDSLKQSVVANAQNLANQFNQLSGQLGQVADAADQSIESDTASANEDLANIAQLNVQIATATATGETADSLVDERQAALEDLASKASITTSTESNGTVDVSIGGVTMVSGLTQSDQLETYDAGGGQILVKAQNAGATLGFANGGVGGSIGGAITARDGELANLQSGLDTLASNLATSVNSVYSAATGQNFFTGSDAASLAVNSSLVSDPSTLQAGTSGSGDGSLAASMAALANQQISGLNNQTFTASYASSVSALGTAISTTTDQLNNSQAVGQMLTNQRDSVSGVNTDEEMTNLIEFQKAYEASAELISTLNQMLGDVMNMVG